MQNDCDLNKVPIIEVCGSILSCGNKSYKNKIQISLSDGSGHGPLVSKSCVFQSTKVIIRFKFGLLTLFNLKYVTFFSYAVDSG